MSDSASVCSCWLERTVRKTVSLQDLPAALARSGLLQKAPAQLTWAIFAASIAWGWIVLDPNFRGTITGRISIFHWANLALFAPTFLLLHFALVAHARRHMHIRFRRFRASLLRVGRTSAELHLDLRCEVHHNDGSETILDVLKQMLDPATQGHLRGSGIRRLVVASPLLASRGLARKLEMHLDTMGLPKSSRNRISAPMGLLESMVIRWYQRFRLGWLGRLFGMHGVALLAQRLPCDTWWTRPEQPGIEIRLDR